MPRPILRAVTALLVPAVLLAGCSSYRSYREAEIAAQVGNWDEAVLHYMEALEQDPANITYKAALLRAKINASREHFQKGREFEKAGVLERAMVEYQQAVQLDPTNQYAMAQLGNVRQALAQRRQTPETLEQMKERNRGARPQPPELDPRSDEPISLEFPEQVSIFKVYRALGQAFGINVLFDPNLRDQEIAIELQEVTAQTALETLMRAGGHF
jgi:general secretion pathway protein D